jgi:HemY protein
MTACEMAIEQGDWQTAVPLLKSLEQQLPHHPHVMLLLKNTYISQNNWLALKGLLPKIKQSHVLAPKAYEQLEQQVWAGLFKDAVQEDILTIKALWKSMPKTLQSDPVLIALYAQLLNRHHQYQECEKLLVKALDKQWDDDLVSLYGDIDFIDRRKALATAEKWLGLHMDSAALLTTLGNLCDRMDLWEKAQRYYEASLSLSPTPQAYTALGAHWEKLNRPEVGGEYFKMALALTTPSLTNS